MMLRMIPEPLSRKTAFCGLAFPAATKVASAIEPTCKVESRKIMPTAKAAMKGKAVWARVII